MMSHGCVLLNAEKNPILKRGIGKRGENGENPNFPHFYWKI